eukprot:COSAG01_NODE_38266_length_491_cov_39.974490_1_plen_49_part_10
MLSRAAMVGGCGCIGGRAPSESERGPSIDIAPPASAARGALTAAARAVA